jgi:uncharacterized protein (DUF1778 family)
MARPKLPDEERRSEVIQLRLTKDERQMLDEAAESLGVLLTELIRSAALAKAERALR